MMAFKDPRGLAAVLQARQLLELRHGEELHHGGAADGQQRHGSVDALEIKPFELAEARKTYGNHHFFITFSCIS